MDFIPKVAQKIDAISSRCSWKHRLASLFWFQRVIFREQQTEKSHFSFR